MKKLSCAISLIFTAFLLCSCPIICPPVPNDMPVDKITVHEGELHGEIYQLVLTMQQGTKSNLTNPCYFSATLFLPQEANDNLLQSIYGEYIITEYPLVEDVHIDPAQASPYTAAQGAWMTYEPSTFEPTINGDIIDVDEGNQITQNIMWLAGSYLILNDTKDGRPYRHYHFLKSGTITIKKEGVAYDFTTFDGAIYTGECKSEIVIK